MKTNKITRIHRFNDFVGVSFEGQPTVYLTEEHAHTLGNALTECAADTLRREFSESKFKTKTIEA